MGERRNRSTGVDTIKWLKMLGALPIIVDSETNAHAWSTTLSLVGCMP